MHATQVVIIDMTGAVDAALLHRAALAIDQQVSHHLAACWKGIDAHVTTAPSISALPPGAWPVFLLGNLPPDEGGVHLDEDNQPYAKVQATNDATWTVDASHEIIEMLVDPFGNRLRASHGIRIESGEVVDGHGTFHYLVEACDPCEANAFAYEIDGIAVSDFITPHYYDGMAGTGVSYSFRGNVTRPRQMLKGGYISFKDAQGTWKQILWVDPEKPPQVKVLGKLGSIRSLRDAVHGEMGMEANAAKRALRRPVATMLPVVRARVEEYAAARSESAKRTEALKGRYGL
jgi:hypothetical protein